MGPLCERGLWCAIGHCQVTVNPGQHPKKVMLSIWWDCKGGPCLNCFQPIPLFRLSSTETSLIVWPFRSSRSIRIMSLLASCTITPVHTLQPVPAISCLTWAWKFLFTRHMVQTWHRPIFIYSCSWVTLWATKAFANVDELNQRLMNFFASKPVYFCIFLFA